jgi:hypothetical protein
MADQWFFAQAGVTHGPYSAGQLKEEAAQGRLLPQDTVWKEGLDKKVLASRVQHLFSGPAAAPLPGPPAREEANPPTPPAVEAAAPPRPSGHPPIPDDPGLLPLDAPAPAPPEAPARRQEPRKKRVLHIKGGVLSSQDGALMKFRKQCLKCSYLDTSMTTMPIPNGCARPSFYCPKCRKAQQVEIQGIG